MNYYNKQGEKITIEEWCSLLKDRSYKIIKQEELENGKFVSTVWLGLDYQPEEGEPPLIFETTVIPMEGNWDEEYCERYSTLEEAEEGHRRIVKKEINKLEHGLALLLKSSRKDLSIKDMATILALVLDSSEVEEFIRELRKEKESIEE